MGNISEEYLNEIDRMIAIPSSANEDRAAAWRRSAGQGTGFEDGALKNVELPRGPAKTYNVEDLKIILDTIQRESAATENLKINDIDTKRQRMDPYIGG